MKENSDKTSASDLAEVSETVELDGMTDIDVRTVLVMMNAMESLEGEQLDQLAELFSTEEVEDAEIVQEGAPLDRYRLETAVKTKCATPNVLPDSAFRSFLRVAAMADGGCEVLSAARLLRWCVRMAVRRFVIVTDGVLQVETNDLINVGKKARPLPRHGSAIGCLRCPHSLRRSAIALACHVIRRCNCGRCGAASGSTS